MKRTTTAPPNISQVVDYSRRLLDVWAWIRTADSLLAAARLLEIEIEKQWSEVIVEDGRLISTSGRTDVHGAYFLLVAFALENFFKAARVNAERPKLRNRLMTSIPPFLKEHDLLVLASAAKLSVSLSEEDLLRRLCRNSVWAGRYPVPTGPTAAQAVAQYSDGRVYLTAYFAPADVENLRLLVGRIRTFAIESIEGDG